MNTQRMLQVTVPFLLLFILLGLLWRELFYAKPNELPSALIGQNMPNFKLPDLYVPAKTFTPANLPHRVALINVWATWCYACSMEQAMLLKIKDQYHIPIYSIDYKDEPQAARAWLQKNGDPYVLTGSDVLGNVAIDFGIYGTPETFVISPAGKIVYRHVGALDQKTWDEVLYPLIQKYEAGQ